MHTVHLYWLYITELIAALHQVYHSLTKPNVMQHRMEFEPILQFLEEQHVDG